MAPRGAEAQAVKNGWRIARPPFIVVPAGESAATPLTQDNSSGSLLSGTAALVLGLCGAIDPALRVGQTVVYARVVQGQATIELDAQLATWCSGACHTATVTAAAVPGVVGNVAAKTALQRSTGAAVIDMEAAAIVRALHARGIRVAMVRVVSDDARSTLPNLSNVYDASGVLRPAALTLALLRNPQRGAQFIADALHALRALQATASRLSSAASA